MDKVCCYRISWLALWCCPILFISSQLTFAAEAISLKVPIVSDTADHHQYFFKLLDQSFTAIDYKVSLRPVRMPQQRALTFLRNGRVDVFWMVVSPKWDSEFIRIDVALTGGLFGHRVLLIRPQDQPKFDAIRNLQDLRNSSLTAGLSASWADVDIWRANGLKFRLYEWNWREIFRDLHDEKSGIDYFPRGINEVVAEIGSYPRLVIERSLALVYDRDLAFYVSRANENKNITLLLNKAITMASQSGLVKNLITEFWGTVKADTRFNDRRQLYLALP